MNDIINERGPGFEFNTQELLLSYLRKWKLIALCVFLGVAIAVGITAFAITPMYRASATIYINNSRYTGDVDYVSSSDLSASRALVKGYVALVKSDPILEKAVEKLGDGYTMTEVKESISAKQIEETVMFTLYVVHSDPERAAAIATAVSDVVPIEGPKVIEGTSARLVNYAKVPTSPYSPSYVNNTFVGAVAGFLVAIVFVTIMFLRDTRIKDENDLTDMFNLPILGRIPDLDGEFVGSRYSYTADND